MKRSAIKIDLGKDQKKVAFSVGRIVDGLQAAGAETDDALRVARNVERELQQRGVKRLEEHELRSLVATRAEEELGPDVAAHWSTQLPPYVPVILVAPDGEHVVFSRRTLAGSLEALGLPFKEAWSLAEQIEQGVRVEGRASMPRGELPQRVALALEARYGREQRVRYEATLVRHADLRVRDGAEHAWPFSRGILARSLVAVGLVPELAFQLAKRVEEALWREVGAVVTRADVRAHAITVLAEEAGAEFAKRFEWMRAIRRPDRPLIVLVGGTAGVGKSEFASELAYRLGISRVVSTDSVRQALRSLISPELSPVLHASSYEAWLAELLPEERAAAKPKRRAVIRGFQAQVLQLGPAMRAIADRNVTEATSVVIEGIHVVPGVSHGTVEGAVVVELMLQVPDPATHIERFARREGRTAARRPRAPYEAHFEEIRLMQEWLLARAAESGVSVLDVTDLDDALDRAVDVILDTVLASGMDEVEEA